MKTKTLKPNHFICPCVECCDISRTVQRGDNGIQGDGQPPSRSHTLATVYPTEESADELFVALRDDNYIGQDAFSAGLALLRYPPSAACDHLTVGGNRKRQDFVAGSRKV